MTAAFLLLTIGGIMVVSSLRGISIVDTLRGEFGDTLDPSGGKPEEAAAPATGAPAGSFAGVPDKLGDLAAGKGSPKAIIDANVIPLAAEILGVKITPASVAAANARHSVLTTSGNRSDHKGPPNVSWAADMSSGSKADMDKLARALAARFNIPGGGRGLQSHAAGNYRYQLIWQAAGHYDHVHFGMKKVK